VYFEVDSFLPVEDRYEFLRNSSYRENVDNGKGFRIRTAKMRGQLSQGLFLRLSLFPELEGCKEGDDVTEKLKVKKWHIPETAGDGGVIIGERPNGIPASDEIRIQSAPELIGELQGKPYYITTKMDGTSGIVYFIDGKVGCCSRNKEIKDDENALYWTPVYKYGLNAIRKTSITCHSKICIFCPNRNDMARSGPVLAAPVQQFWVQRPLPRKTSGH